MDADRFDLLARALAATPSRRWVSRALAGLGLGGGLSALLGATDIEAKKKKKGKKKCKPCRKKKKGKCKGKKADGTPCGGENVCLNGQCVPPSPPTCDPPCVDPEVCEDGQCVPPTCDPPCVPPQECVDGQCVAPTCDPPCVAPLECDNGECVCPADTCCPACGSSEVCDGGVCVCAPENIFCGGACCDVGDDEVCELPVEVCQGGGCPASNFCVDEAFFRCDNGCFCVTSVEDTNACTDLANVGCAECTTDLQCTTALGQDALCIPNGEFCTNCPGTTNFCVATGCPSGGGDTCEVETDYCVDPETTFCSTGTSCVCTTTVDPMATNACVDTPPLFFSDCVPCTSNAGCGAGEVCIAGGEFCGESCGAGFCWPLCGEGTLMAAERSGERSLKDAGAAKGSGSKRRDRQRGGRKRGGPKRSGRKQRH